ncbi:winged helix DNA-binding domain-containing protein [Bacteroides sp. 51]|uniref:winged helix DNA-binding domain-containing protein n=1 Tax=Bacteroides sp. 51 TaxID=2302938 RepID=UPI0013CF78BB|nr:winged helix DNA-binding domain-containing protein [Bacteroides sp. 51]NDV82282.1 winged helix DNA-binding domain-containing protein [Bacteroides sp. 51]
MITNIRVLSQQLSASQFDQPKDLVKWMGAMQAQEYTMAKWAIGARLKSSSLQQVEEALERGEIIRTHVMRPTWHFVPAEDLRWMLQLSGERVKKAYDSYAKRFGIPESTHTKCGKIFEKILRDNNHLTKLEIGEELIRAGVLDDPNTAHYFINRAEATGQVCSGREKNKKFTYALIDERIAPTKELHKEEALAELARRYFRSHSPASLQDFLWWSGLTITETRKAINLISDELNKDRFASQELFIHQSWVEYKPCDDVLHFLPPFDEYLISYKDRSAVLDPKHYPKAFNNFGTFYPVILHNGKIIGNWERVTKKGGVSIETTFFEKKTKVEKELLKEAEKKYLSYLSNK